MMYNITMKQKIISAFFLCVATLGFPAGKIENPEQKEIPLAGGQQVQTMVSRENPEPGKIFPVLTKEGVYSCGKQPKQVIFTPDGKYIVLPLLDENGFDIFDIETKKIIKRINPPGNSQKGFVEGIFIPEKSSFFISQMTTNSIYEYSYPGFEFKREIPTGGIWSKFIAWNKEQNYIAVSNWVSNNISIIDYNTGELLALIETEKAPRGIIFTEDGKSQGRQNDLQMIAQEGRITKIGREGIPFEQGPPQHERRTHHASEAHAATVENDTAEEEHQQEDVDVPVGSGEESIFRTAPPQAAFGNRRGTHHFE